MILVNYRIHIETTGLVIRTLGDDTDFNVYRSWFEDKDVKKNIEFGKENLPTIGDLQKYVTHMNESPVDLLCGIFTKENQHLGNIKFGPVDFKNESATVGVLIGAAIARGRGVFGEAFHAVSQHLFSEFNISHFKLGVAESNLAAIRAYQKAGFVIASEGKSADQSTYFSMEYRISH